MISPRFNIFHASTPSIHPPLFVSRRRFFHPVSGVSTLLASGGPARTSTRIRTVASLPTHGGSSSSLAFSRGPPRRVASVVSDVCERRRGGRHHRRRRARRCRVLRGTYQSPGVGSADDGLRRERELVAGRECRARDVPRAVVIPLARS